ncbi:RNA polymerase sigma factor [Isoptericola jiangsuensis]|uniref:RNA polymerase sigma factor n=1 Tax=Isoptericola jiangsuensis TaxID=548579 RepID=UPI003869CC6A
MNEQARPALMELLTQSYGELRRRLTRALGSDDLADDALHDTWLQLRRKEGTVTDVLNPRAFLMRMAVNSAISSLRSRNRAVPRAEIDALLDVADPTPGPEQVAGGRADLEALTHFIGTMPQRRQDILLLVRLEGLSQRDVATRLGVSLSTVEQELKKANLYCAKRMRMAGRQ